MRTLSAAVLVLLFGCSSDSTADACGSIAGGYAITEDFDAATCPAGRVAITDSLSVTVTGNDVKLTNGTTFLSNCTLNGCSCTTKGGDVYKFSSTGFTRASTDNGCKSTMSGTKK